MSDYGPDAVLEQLRKERDEAVSLLRAWTSGCGDEHFSTKDECRDLLERSGRFLASLYGDYGAFMKSFRYPLGHVAATTMTVSELRERLNDFPQDMAVFGIWEGVWGEIRPDDFAVMKYGDGPEGNEKCLLIDVDQHKWDAPLPQPSDS